MPAINDKKQYSSGGRHQAAVEKSGRKKLSTKAQIKSGEDSGEQRGPMSHSSRMEFGSTISWPCVFAASS